jgi:hypothetical protein
MPCLQYKPLGADLAKQHRQNFTIKPRARPAPTGQRAREIPIRAKVARHTYRQIMLHLLNNFLPNDKTELGQL